MPPAQVGCDATIPGHRQMVLGTASEVAETGQLVHYEAMEPVALGLSSEWLARLAAQRESVLDLCTGRSPYSPPAHAISPVDAHTAQSQLAQRLQLAPARVLLGHGASELALHSARALVQQGSVWLAVEPAQDGLSGVARQAGARVVRWRSVERTGHSVDLAQIAELMRLESPQVVSLWAPGSPTGASVPWRDLCALAEAFPTTQFLVNQSWLSLSDDHADWERAPLPNMICVRSLALDHAAAGVRAGYVLAEPETIARIAAARGGGQVSAQAAALLSFAARDRQFVAESRAQLTRDRVRLTTLLDELGLSHTPSVAPFSLVRIARASEVSEELFEQHGVAVFDATASGLPDHVRISSLPREHATRAKTALERVLQRRGLVRGREP